MLFLACVADGNLTLYINTGCMERLRLVGDAGFHASKKYDPFSADKTKADKTGRFLEVVRHTHTYAYSILPPLERRVRLESISIRMT